MAKIDFKKIAKDSVEQSLKEFELITGATLKETVEKQIPKKLDYEADGYDDNGNLLYDYAKCPICGNEYEYEINDWGCNYCSNCGQKLDWT